MTYHGIALNVTVDLADFDLIDPCGMPGVGLDVDRRRARRARRPADDRVGRARRVDLRRGARRRARRAARRGPDATWPPVCSSCARTRSPAGGSRRSSTAPSTATGSRVPPSRSTTTSSAAPTARRPRATGSGSGCSRTSRSTSSAPATTRASSIAVSPRSRSPRLAPRGAGGRSSRRPVSIGRSTPSATRSSRRSSGRGRDALAEARATGQTDYLQVVQNWGAQAGARTNHLCLDLYDLPQIPHRIAEELGGAARFVIREGECPFCRLVRDEIAPAGAARLGGRTRAWPSPRTPRARRSRSGSCRVATRRTSAAWRRPTSPRTAEALRQVLARLAASLDGPPYNLVLHTAPLREQVDATYHWHWEIHPRLREIAGLELGHRPAGQPGLARGRGRGAARPSRCPARSGTG